MDIPGVWFTGFLNRSEIGAAYSTADVFVLPSAFHETWGIVVNEAMNFSLPVVVSYKVGCAPDLVREGENGFVVSHNSESELEKAIEVLVTDESLRRNFGRRSRELIDTWHYGITVNGMVEACQTALSLSRVDKRRFGSTAGE